MDAGNDVANYLKNPEIAPFFRALNEGRLLIRTCRECGRPHYYPRALCPFCFGATDWTDCSGNATLYSFSIMRKAAVAYVVAYVRLQEGVTMLTNIIDCDFNDLRIGMPVKAVFSGPQVAPGTVAFAPG